MRAAILHDWIYAVGDLPRAHCDAVFYRALTFGDGTARWRATIFWLGVRLGGSTSYTKTPTSSGFFTPGPICGCQSFSTPWIQLVAAQCQPVPAPAAWFMEEREPDLTRRMLNELSPSPKPAIKD